MEPEAGDWAKLVKDDLNDKGIILTLEEIEDMSKIKFKKTVKMKLRKYTLNLLLEKKQVHSKMKNVEYTDLKLQKYFENTKFTKKQMNDIFKFRTHMTKAFKDNYRGSNEKVVCEKCHTHTDSQEEIVRCKILNSKIKDVEKIRKNYKDNIEVETVDLLDKILKTKVEEI